MTGDLFRSQDTEGVWSEQLGPGTTLLHGLAIPDIGTIHADLQVVLQAAPFRKMTTPGGFQMSIAITNCGSAGWISDRLGYRYDARDPLTGRPWPFMPASFNNIAQRAAQSAGFEGFVPDACLINCYEIGARLSLHQDRNERDYRAPIVSVSLGLPAVFLFGGLNRSDTTLRLSLQHGDVLVWGGADRLRFHGVLPLAAGRHAILNGQRINLTFRKAL